LLYGAVGSTNLSVLQTAHIANSEQKLLLYFGSALILIGLAFKISIVPFHMWTPDAYEGAPTVITAFMSAATKTAAFTVLIRIFMLNIQGDMVSLQWVLWVLAIITMVVGNIIALAQENIKRLLAYSSIAHAGYITVGAVACYNDKEVIGSILYYLIVYAAMNIGAFIVISYLEDEKDFLSISHYKGLGYRKPWIGIALSWFLFCLAGLPPTCGFLAKYYVFLMAVRKGFPILVVIAVLNSALAAYYYLRIVVYIWMYGKEQGKALPKREQELAMIGKLAIIIALCITIYFSFMPSLVLQLAKSF
jgi:NADH-quinone oxidoreductase subunit N